MQHFSYTLVFYVREVSIEIKRYKKKKNILRGLVIKRQKEGISC